MEKEMATHSSILAWKIPRRGAWQATVHRVVKESDMTQQLNKNKRPNWEARGVTEAKYDEERD